MVRPSLALRGFVLALLALSAVSADRVAAQPDALPTYDEPRAPGPRIRVLSEDARSVTVEVTTDWDTPLASALAASGADPERLVLAAVGGRAELSETIELGAAGAPTVEVLALDAVDVPLDAASAEALRDLDRPAVEVVGVGEQRKRIVGTLAVRTLRVSDGRLQRVRRVVARVTRPAVRARLAARGDDNPHLAVGRSVLADGTWFKVPISAEGVYRLDAAYLRDSLGVAAPDLGRVAVYGNGGRILPALNSAPRPADLGEVPSWISGDALFFYAEAPQWWDWVTDEDGGGYWSHDISPFSEETMYFVRVDAESPRRVEGGGFPGWSDAAPQATIQARRFHEVDNLNYERDQSGSGLDWLGERLDRSSDRLFLTDPVPAGFVAGQTVRYRTRVGARANPGVTVTARAGGQTLVSLRPRSVNLGGLNDRNLIEVEVEAFERPDAQDVTVGYRFAGGNSSAEVWLDWVEAVFDVDPTAEGGVLRFATPGGADGRLEFALAGFTAEPQVWDVTEPAAIRRLGVQAAGGRYLVQIDVAGGSPRELVAFVPGGSAVRPLAKGVSVPNQNLHGLTGTPDYVVVSHSTFLPVATQLAERRRDRDGLEPVVVTVEQVFNEFASGVSDMRAVRDYMKFLYDRAPEGETPGYLLLFGDGHYDFRNLKTDVPNYVPVYESENMINRNASFMSDDYFGLLGDDEGIWPFLSNSSTSGGRVDLAIGRIPARTIEDAASVLDKIRRYESPETRGEWRSRFTFVGDDQFPNATDRDLHVQNADVVARVAKSEAPAVTLQKIYAPSFPLDRGVRGDRRPLVNEAIRQAINEGTLVWNYSGHGGPDGLGDENYVDEGLLNGLDNADRLPVFVTATCSFGKFDITDEQSLAEQFLLTPGKGGVAMLTTVRIVYTSSSTTGLNLGLNIELTEQMLRRDAQGRPVRLGDALFATKNTAVGAQHNNRKFNLLGDPALRLGLPERPVTVEVPAELKAFEEVTVSGTVLRADSTLDTSFSGEVTVNVFDAARTVDLPPDACCSLGDTNGNRDSDYQLQTDRIFSGRARVTAGRYQASFLVPQDISYSGQAARVAAYVSGAAGAATVDGYGESEDAVVSAQAGTRPNDGEGPAVRLFLNDTTFVAGSAVAPGATLIARLQDASGINTVGAGVGHTLLLTIDGDAQNAIDVGSAYVGDVGTYRSGEVRFPLPDLAPGPHTLTLTAWDAVNNASTAELSFVQEAGEALAVRSVLPYPNPTSGPTRFVFEHNRVGAAARVQLRIYTLAGRPIRTIGPDEALPGGLLANASVQIPWDGLDDDGDRLASGVYLFRLRLETPGADGATDVAERVERLAIIR